MDTNENFVDGVETVELPPPEDATTAEGTVKKKKMPKGKPFTKETSAAAQIKATTAKRMRKIARAKMLQALTTELDLGDELVKAFKSNDERRISIVEKALKIVGLHHDQSSEALAQRFEVKSNNETTLKSDGSIKFVIEDAKADDKQE